MNLLEQIEKMKFIREPEFVSTGSYVLDYILSGRIDGTGGWPIGTICEITGEEYSGKSYVCAKTIAEFQTKYGNDAFILLDDTEGAANYEWMKKLGVIFNHTLLCTSLQDDATREFTRLIMKVDTKNAWSSSITVAKAFQRIRAMCEHEALQDKKLLFIIDSIGNMSCEYELEYDGERVDQGQKAKEIKQGIRLTTDPIARRKALLLCTNHNISGPGGYGDTTTAGGGKGLKYGSTMRVSFSKPGKIKEEKTIIGVKLFIETLKSRYVPPFSKAELCLYWDKAIPRYEGVVEKLVELGFLSQTSGWYTIPGKDEKLRKTTILEMLEQGELDNILKEASQ